MLLQVSINVFAELAKQGPLILSLVTAIYYFYQRQNKAEASAKEQADKIENLLKEDRAKMLTIIENNTNVMKENTAVLIQLSKQTH